MRCLKDEIQTRGLNIVIPSAHHGPVAANTGHEEWQDKALLQQSRKHRIHRVLKLISPVSHLMVLPLVRTPGMVLDLATSDGYEARICALRSCSRSVISSRWAAKTCAAWGNIMVSSSSTYCST